MKRKNFDFQWFEKEDRRSELRASVGKDRKLRIGRKLRSVLPRFIRIGFDAQACVLAIADGEENDIIPPECGVLGAQALSAQIVSIGLQLPVSFRIVKDSYTGFFLGEVIPNQKIVNGKMQYDTAQLLVIYRHLVDDMVRKFAKSTPRSERRSIAEEAFCAAVQNYQSSCGDLKTYLENQIHRVSFRKTNSIPLHIGRNLWTSP